MSPQHASGPARIARITSLTLGAVMSLGLLMACNDPDESTGEDTGGRVTVTDSTTEVRTETSTETETAAGTTSTQTPEPAPAPEPEADTRMHGFLAPAPTPARPASTHFSNCREARAAGAAPLYEGSPGYSRKLDRDGDGVACE
ncbi:excalibur calcium-binding domain-containing protein [Corynebacterium sp. CCM 9185]|uniref:Excalibur calcium-binding domain-containing protein n=1 Tax=Corynebacterium marambiense TaxID=2765364 RepID=A0ABS0VRK1_9CORY|nr:excalibur calcium-binding domain-containing protein [Corynebacterium marambiense]MBI8999409.1 excalibur calcium-binding domain-containing protein [Corynebacterium marambiense]MCK7662247.1 excalibur calcium-binding domain-containing protein [Corynebacterium marambiense]MCX7541515.1 excalibur calcium-binding domain-containing protein [Corynebacterium marambiense]